MPTPFSDQFFYIDPFSPPGVGAQLDVFDLTGSDVNDDGVITPTSGDTINGFDIIQSYNGDTVTVNVSGEDQITYTGVTFYIASAQWIFTPTDGQLLQSGAFVSATGVPSQGSVTTSALSPPCFAASTLIETPSGPRRVETLVAGDIILTADGGTTTVLWLGLKTCTRLSYGSAMQPVRIRAGALGEGLPTADLTVTADHGMIFDDLVINASALVNGDMIDFHPMAELPRQITYYHIETDAHDVILANGTPTETFVDYVGRTAFDNYAEYLELYGAERIIPEMHRLRISTRRMLPNAMRARLGIASVSEPLPALLAS
ncbi:Hint domain protein (plasmid) [Antarctobacter heliothermus]|uniref:Hint domain protein n=1 Tax=Antarctobacter heliothermus TaxID=74033 RepID=A0A222EBY9_9RHOB|nr:Hint domain-containing protein [Antarctobacter heliothermus]ASP23695.1 Hint domain protein [Antarctobacter heliothermus]